MTSISSAVAACRAAQLAWAARPLSERLRPVREFRYLLVERADQLAAAVNADIDRPALDVVATELLPTASACKFLWQSATGILRPKRIGWRPMWLLGCRDTVHRRPRGVVALLGTWNYPIYLTAVPILHALVAGNAVAWKPSEYAPRTAEVLHELLLAAGFPPEVLVRLPATREAGPELAEADIDFLHFTGSDGVGRKLAARLGERLIPSALELSGCDALFVLPDANVTMAARAAWYSATMNRGQTCMATRRAFVHRGVYEQFVAVLKPLVEAEAPMKLVTPGQVEKALHVIADSGGTVWNPSPLVGERGRGEGDSGSVAGGLTLEPSSQESPSPLTPLLGRDAQPAGQARPDWAGRGEPERTITPTLLLDPSPDSPITTAATFAPLLAVMPFDDLGAAIAASSRCPFGLAAAVFTADRAAGAAVAKKLHAGAVVVNDVVVPTAHPETPFGGRKASGWGVTQGVEGLLEMTVPQVVTHRKGTFRPHVELTLNRDPAADDTMRGMLRFTHGRRFRDRWRGFWQMVSGFRRVGKSKPG